MTDAEQEHALALWIANVNNNVLGLQHWARRLETAVKIGAYDAVDAPALAELIYLASTALQRTQVLIDVDKVIAEEQRKDKGDNNDDGS